MQSSQGYKYKKVCVLVHVCMFYLSMITGSDGVSFLFPQLFLSQQRLTQNRRTAQKLPVGTQNYCRTQRDSPGVESVGGQVQQVSRLETRTVDHALHLNLWLILSQVDHTCT